MHLNTVDLAERLKCMLTLTMMMIKSPNLLELGLLTYSIVRLSTVNQRIGGALIMDH